MTYPMSQFDPTRLLISTGLDEPTANAIGRQLLEAYNEPQRHYHTISHVTYMLELAQSKTFEFTEKTIIELAIWFHDCVYDPTKGGPWNEEESICIWEEVVDKAPANLERYRKAVSSLIRCTISHEPPPSLPSSMFRCAATFLDLDMAILAGDPSAYDAYAMGIRKEYAHFSVDEYRAGRTQVLENFLRREKIFLLENEEMEMQARENIKREIEELKLL